MANRNIEISIIITAHREGYLAHRTMLSVFRAIKKLDENKISYEILVSIDKGNSETVNYFKRYQNNKNIKLYYYEFGDLSLSRNATIRASHGKFVTTLDADDLISENWLLSAYQLSQKRLRVIVHPNFVVTFGILNVITQIHNFDDGEDLLRLIDGHEWTSVGFGPRGYYKEHPYSPNRGGFGAEDKKFNLDTLADGITHVFAPETVLFYRRDNNRETLLDSQTRNFTTIAKTKALSFDAIKKINVANYIFNYKRSFVKIFFWKCLRVVTRTRIYRRFYKNIIITLLRDLVVKRKLDRYPQWLINEWKAVNKIEKKLWPTNNVLTTAVWWQAPIEPGVAYARVIQKFSKMPNTLFFVPWLIKGGADKVFINTANEIGKIHSNWKVAMLQTEEEDSVWKNQLSDKIEYVNWWDITNGLDEATQHRLIATLVVQNDIKRIIIGHSSLGFEFVAKHKGLLQNLNVKIYIFAFTEGVHDDGRIDGFVHNEIPNIYDVAYKVITDNSFIVDQLKLEHGLDPQKIVIHHQYVDGKIIKPVVKDNKRLKILWASRITDQKCPGLLKRIGEKLDCNEFTIDAYGVLEEPFKKSFFNGSGINYCGSYNGIDSLPTDKYDVFLYTSNADGLPNVLLEIAGKGLPIVASNVGGISDFIINKKTGLLVNDADNPVAYVDTLNDMKDINLRKKISTNAQKLLKHKFSYDKWRAGIKDIFDR